jgi:hypothetical protein
MEEDGLDSDEVSVKCSFDGAKVDLVSLITVSNVMGVDLTRGSRWRWQIVLM